MVLGAGVELGRSEWSCERESRRGARGVSAVDGRRSTVCLRWAITAVLVVVTKRSGVVSKGAKERLAAGPELGVNPQSCAAAPGSRPCLPCPASKWLVNDAKLPVTNLAASPAHQRVHCDPAKHTYLAESPSPVSARSALPCEHLIETLPCCDGPVELPEAGPRPSLCASLRY